MTERIYVHVDDAELRELSSRLDTSMTRMKKVDKDTFKLDTRTKAILTRLPGLREADMLWREIQSLSTTTAGVEGAAGALATGSAALMMMIVILSILKRIERLERTLVREAADYENMLREGLELSHKEYMELAPEVRGFATMWEQFEHIVEKQGVLEAWMWRIEGFLKSLVAVEPKIPGAPIEGMESGMMDVE